MATRRIDEERLVGVAGIELTAECAVWWADPEDLVGYHDVLSPVERERMTTMLRPQDQIRQAGGAVLLRLAVSALTGRAPAAVTVHRSCPDCARPHGRPTLPEDDLHASISHSGDVVAVAVTHSGPVGVDVEAVAPLRTEGLAASVLGDGEHASDTDAFYRYWARKESVIKATGDGLRAPLKQVVVTAPAEPAALLGYPGGPPPIACMADLAIRPGYAAALTVLHPGPLRVSVHRYQTAEVME